MYLVYPNGCVFEENDTIDLGTYLDKEMSECGVVGPVKNDRCIGSRKI